MPSGAGPARPRIGLPERIAVRSERSAQRPDGPAPMFTDATPNVVQPCCTGWEPIPKWVTAKGKPSGLEGFLESG